MRTTQPQRQPDARGMAARFRRLSRAKQLLLVCLGALGLMLIIATGIYAFPSASPSGGASPISVSAQTPGAATQTVAPLVAGNFEQVGDGTQAELALRQYDDAITGMYTQRTCAGGAVHTTQRIITGEALPDGTVRLTFSAPDLPHSQTVLYQFFAQQQGFELSWRDALGRTQAQLWLPEMTPLPALTCGG